MVTYTCSTMTKQTYIKISGDWEEVKSVWLRTGGVWKENVMPHVRVGGEWKECMEYYAVGDEGPGGGLIVYDKGEYSDGWRYLEIAPKDWNGSSDPEAEWGCKGTEINNVGFSTGHEGKENTEEIVSQCAESGIAAKLCDDYSGGNMNDWFLPSFGNMYQSRNELTKLCDSEDDNYDTYGMSTDNYWTSSQQSDDEAYAISDSFGSGDAGTFDKDLLRLVRPFRRF